jgi:hypothetical protein
MHDEDDNQIIARPLPLLITSVLFACTGLYMGFQVPEAMRNFRVMFAEQGLDVDPATRLVFEYPNVWWLFAAASVGALIWVVSRPRATRAQYRTMRYVVGTVIAFTVFAFGFAAFAVYSPLLAPR